MADAVFSTLVEAPAPKSNMGEPVPRYDARAKVTGSALYASDVALPDVAYAFLVSSAIAKGRVRSFDLREARALPGVLDILTHDNIGDAIRPVKFFTEGGPASNSVLPLGSPEIAYGGQTIAVVLADSYEVATPRIASWSTTRSTGPRRPSRRPAPWTRSWRRRTRSTTTRRSATSRAPMRRLP